MGEQYMTSGHFVMLSRPIYSITQYIPHILHILNIFVQGQMLREQTNV